MVSLIKKVTNWAFYPWLLTLYPVIYLYSTNFGDVRDDDVLEVVFVALMSTTVMYALSYLLTHNSYKAGAVTGIMALVFLTYGHLYNALDNTDLGQKLLMPVMLVMVVMAIVLILRSKAVWQQLTPYLNLICMFLVIMPLLQVIRFGIDKPQPGATALANPLERVVSTSKVNNSPDRPDIYYIILDGYSSNEFWLREYGYDNSDFTDALEERGFYVAYDSRSNYGVTIVSLPSSLNMRYITNEDRNAAHQRQLPDDSYLRSLIANNLVADELRHLGYTYVYMLSGYLSPSTLADKNIIFYPDGPEYFSGSEFQSSGSDGAWTYKQNFWTFFLETTLLRSMASYFDVQEEGQPLAIYSPELFRATLEEVETIPAMDEATFTFVHIIKPHGPIQFDREGNIIEVQFADDDPQKVDYFFDELHYLNTRVLGLIDYIQAESSVPPIIVLQADHGSDLGSPWDYWWRWSHFDIMNAFYLPGYDEKSFDNTIAPVNSFRVILDHYFDSNYEILESRQYTVPRGWWYKDYFTHVQHIDDGRLNVELGDHIMLIYNVVDENDAPEFHVYALSDDGDKGNLLLTITYEDVESYLDTPPEQNTLIMRQGPIAFYALTTGEFQFNIGPDSQGKEWAVIVDTLPARVIYGHEVGAN
jgi:hypothetical protein